jgi:UDP-glucuronate decarboxylase
VDDLIEGMMRMMDGDDPLQRKPDISLAGEKLGWAPAVNLEDGLKRTIAYFETIVRS